MNQGRLNEMIEQAMPEERHQCYAGSYSFIVELNNRLTAQRRALGERMTEAGIPELELEQERN